MLLEKIVKLDTTGVLTSENLTLSDSRFFDQPHPLGNESSPYLKYDPLATGQWNVLLHIA